MSVIASGAIYAQGFGLGAGLIIAIGAQNAFVLRQGLKREHHMLIATICALSDALLMGLGAAGVGSFIAGHPTLANFATLFGAAFLFVYGTLAFRRAWIGEHLDAAAMTPTLSVTAAITTTLAFTYLNPHALLDTVVLVGGLSAQFEPPQRMWFVGGAISASFVWFYSLAFAAGKLAPMFKKPRTWRILDGLIGITVWAIAITLVL